MKKQNSQGLCGKRHAFINGYVDGFSIPSLIIFTTMIGFGALVKTTSLNIYIAIFSTLFIWGLPGQVAMVEALAVGAPLSVLSLSVAMANMRFFPMAVSMVQLFRDDTTGWRWRYLLVHFMSVNTWVGIIQKAPLLESKYRAAYFIGFAATCMISGVLGTIIGFQLADLLSFAITAALVFLNPVYFTLIFFKAQGRALKFSIFFGCLLGPLVYLLLPNWGLPIVGVLAGSAGFVLDNFLRKSDV